MLECFLQALHPFSRLKESLDLGNRSLTALVWNGPNTFLKP
jgi:hypothetical protein